MTKLTDDELVEYMQLRDDGYYRLRLIQVLTRLAGLLSYSDIKTMSACACADCADDTCDMERGL